MSLTALWERKKTINLLPRDPWEKTWWGEVLEWGLMVGKWIVIVTQLIVMGVFLMRFSLDRRLNDLNKDIGMEVAKIKAYETVENEFRRLQERVKIAKSAIEKRKVVFGILEKVARMTPGDIWLERIEVSPKDLRLVAYTSSIGSFSRFLRAMQTSELFTNISLESVSSGAEKRARLKFALQASLGGEGGKNEK